MALFAEDRFTAETSERISSIAFAMGISAVCPREGYLRQCHALAERLNNFGIRDEQSIKNLTEAGVMHFLEIRAIPPADLATILNIQADQAASLIAASAHEFNVLMEGVIRRARERCD